MTATVPRWVRVCTVTAVVVVAGVAAVVSYAHMRHLAELAGEAWRADILPLSVDGLLVAASLVLLVRRKAGRRAGLLPWVGLLLGVAASLVANVAAAQPTVLGRVVAGWPPLAFAVSFELLVAILRDGRPPTHRVDIPIEAVDEDPVAELPDFWSAAPFADTSSGRAAALLEQGAGRRKLARELGISEHAARQLKATRTEAAS
jgi:Protein of unknown function (DUF2637)